jgi:hypothetical protein
MKKRVMRLFGIFVAAMVVMAGSGVYAADVYVKAGASGKGSSPSDPYGELWKAVDRATRGDVIHVAKGVYNGKGGSGHFVVKVPNLTMAGGYNDDFTERDPFKNLTVLERSKDYKGDWTGLPESGAIVAGDLHADHGDFILDGFALNGESRNSYENNNTKIRMKDSYPGMLVGTNSKNTKIRNCILLNPLGDGVYCTWQGEGNEISNNFILNTFYAAIETRSAQPDSVIEIKNNTIAFGWSYPSKGGAIGVFVGRQGKTVVDGNVIAFMQTEGDEDGFAVKNTFGNDETVMKNNVFFSLSGGFYKYMDSNKQSLVLWQSGELDDLNEEDTWEDYMLSESGGNREADPGLDPDKTFATIFANFVGSEPGKLNMDMMNEWRRSVGLPLQAEPGTARENYGPPYPLAAVVPNLVSKIPGVGAQVAGPFETYKSEAAEETALNYEAAEFASFKKGGANSTGLDGKPVEFKANLGDKKLVYEIDAAPREEYICVQLLPPGTTGPTMDAVMGYLQKGSEAQKDWDKLFAKKDKYNKNGITVRGKAYGFKNQNYNYPVGIVILEVDKK